MAPGSRSTFVGERSGLVGLREKEEKKGAGSSHHDLDGLVEGRGCGGGGASKFRPTGARNNCRLSKTHSAGPPANRPTSCAKQLLVLRRTVSSHSYQVSHPFFLPRDFLTPSTLTDRPASYPVVLLPVHHLHSTLYPSILLFSITRHACQHCA